MSHILVVDDDLGLLCLLRQLLEGEGHRVDVAADGMSAISKVKATNPDLLLLDIHMPNKDGFEIAMDLKKTPPDPPIVAMSGGGYVGPYKALDVAAKMGCVATLSKPFSADELKLAVGFALKIAEAGPHCLFSRSAVVFKASG